MFVCPNCGEVYEEFEYIEDCPCNRGYQYILADEDESLVDDDEDDIPF